MTLEGVTMGNNYIDEVMYNPKRDTLVIHLDSDVPTEVIELISDKLSNINEYKIVVVPEELKFTVLRNTRSGKDVTII